MRKFWLLGTLAGLTLGASYVVAQSPAPLEARIERCLVSLIDDVKVPAESAGVLSAIEAREGLQVEVGTMLATVDDRQVQLQKKVADAEHRVSKEKADNDVNVRYAQAVKKVAEKEYWLNAEANKIHPGAITRVVIDQLLLKVEQAALQIEQSQHEQQVAKYETDGYAAKVSLADDEIRRRHIKAPVSGEVVEVMFRPGEWVEPGNEVLRLVRLDRLRIEGFLNASEFSPSEISNRPVRVTVALARGRKETFQGKIVFVNPLVQAGGEYRVWAEVVNRMENNQWLLRPGLDAEMIIDVGAAAARSASR
jgi:macrolide-specific efflux system membrane fusion protein